jgi:hypothetical protein
MSSSFAETGPIVACGNAIDHYNKLLAAENELARKLNQQLGESRDRALTYGAMLTTWVEAKDVLVQAQEQPE